MAKINTDINLNKRRCELSGRKHRFCKAENHRWFKSSQRLHLIVDNQNNSGIVIQNKL